MRLMQSFRRRQILPDDAAFFSMDGLVWPEETENVAVLGIPLGGPLGFSKDEQRQSGGPH